MKIIELSRKTIISRIFPGDPAQVRAARRFVSEALGDRHPCRDDAVQLIGELIAESLRHAVSCRTSPEYAVAVQATADSARVTLTTQGDRKSTRLNSSHVKISYAVFCLKKTKKAITWT